MTQGFHRKFLSFVVLSSTITSSLLATSDHFGSKADELLERGAIRSEVSTQSLTDLISLGDLNEAVEVAQELNGTYSFRIKNSTASEKARDKIRAALEGLDVLSLITTQFEEEIELSVYNKSRSTITKQTGPFLGAAVMVALSMPSRDRFRGGRRLFLRDQNKKFTSVSVLSRESESLDTIRTNLNTTKEWADKLGIKFKFTNRYSPTEPPQQFFNWNESEQKFQLVPNDKARESWDAKEEARRVLENSSIALQLKELKSQMGSNKPAEVVAEEFLLREDIAPQVYHSSNNGNQAGKILKRAIVKFLQRREDPNRPDSFHVSKRNLGYRESVVSAPKQNVERVAFVYPDENSSLRKNTARASGIQKIYDITHPSQAIPIIKKTFETTGKPVEVCFCSHGSPGSLVMASPSSSEIARLTRETKGMVCGAYALGCSVGAQAENTSRPHLLRELSVGWGVPVSAVDQTLYLDNQKWYLQGSGRLVTVFPENQEVSSKELIDQTPVWLDKE